MLNRNLFILSLISLITLSLVIVPSVEAKNDPFLGSWQGTDGDGSHWLLNIGGGNDVYRITWLDDGSTTCGTDEQGVPIYGDMSRGTGEANANELTITVQLWCKTSPPIFHNEYTLTFVYVESDGTLRYFEPPYNYEVVLHRSGN